jgi:hypothetical protein
MQKKGRAESAGGVGVDVLSCDQGWCCVRRCGLLLRILSHISSAVEPYRDGGFDRGLSSEIVISPSRNSSGF